MNHLQSLDQLFYVMRCLGFVEMFIGILQKSIEKLSVLGVLQDEVNWEIVLEVIVEFGYIGVV